MVGERLGFPMITSGIASGSIIIGRDRTAELLSVWILGFGGAGIGLRHLSGVVDHSLYVVISQ